MNGTPSPRRGWRAARKREKTITVTIANTYRTEGEKSRENIASILFGPSLLYIWVRTSRRLKNPWPRYYRVISC